MIIYPVFFIIPGMLALAAATTTSQIPFLFLTLFLVFLSAISGWLRLLVVIVIGLLVARLILSDIGVVSAALCVLGGLLLLVGGAVRCPRCRDMIAPRRQLWTRMPKGGWCPMCGRSQRRVWPFQYLRQPESWDGAYHDEGGGPAPSNATVEWWRYELFQRWQRRHRQ